MRQQGCVDDGRGRHVGRGVGHYLTLNQARHQRGDLGHPVRVGGETCST